MPSACTLCGAALDSAASSCPICLEPRDRSRSARGEKKGSLRRALAVWILLPFLFLATCTGLIPASMTLTDPLTHRSLAGQPIPVLLMEGHTPRIVTLRAPYRPPPPPPGASYLIPEGRESAIERHFNDDPAFMSTCDLRITPRGEGRQFIELTFIDDGYAGAAYDATASSITPRYVRQTGPGYAFIFGGTAILINAILWSVAAGAVRWYRRRRVNPSRPA